MQVNFIAGDTGRQKGIQ